MDFANEGRSWEGAELIIQLPAEGSPTGTPLSRAEEAQEAPGHDPAPLQPPLSDSLCLEHPDIQTLFPPVAPWGIFPRNQSVQQYIEQHLQCHFQLRHPKLADFHQ